METGTTMGQAHQLGDGETYTDDMSGDGHFEHAAVVAKLVAAAAEAERRLAAQARRILELEALSYTDELTGLYNRRGMTEAINRALSSAHRHNETGGLAYLDLDGFKAINDKYGHEAGDAMLRAAADCIRAQVRNTDTAARLGGDEFAILFAKGDPSALRAKAERIRIVLMNTLVDLGPAKVTIRASLGFAQYRPGMTRDRLVAAADSAMYADKRTRKAAGFLIEAAG
jgi:diguanylate cyclase (GGDEF)-like protein